MTGNAIEVEALRVVLVDDTDDLRELLRIALERGGMQVVGEAADGAQGIEVVRDAQPDVVLLDLSMPVMDGLAALPHVRAIAPEATIIVLSGFGASQMAERALANGADGYLQKGMSLSQVLARVQEIVGQARPAAPAPPRLHVVPDEAVSPGDAVALAPYGVVEVEPAAPFRVVHANPAAAELAGVARLAGGTLADAAPDLAALAETHLATGQDNLIATIGGRAIRTTFRQASRSLLLYLEPVPADVDALRRTVAATAHEIRGPVAVLNALAETISHHRIPDGLQRDRLMSSVARQARVLDGITADLLITAQAERGSLRVEAEAVDPREAVAAIVEDLQVPVTIQVHDGRPVRADPLRLDQMVSNLLRNAVKYGEPPIVVRVRGHDQRPDHLQIDVEDQGPGVPEEFRSRLFQEFSRAEVGPTGGVGLGLHVVRTLAQAHGGSVTYTPRSGGGSVFTLTLPAG